MCTLRCQVGCYAQASLNLDFSEVSCRPARAHYNVASQGCAAVGSEGLTGSMAPSQANLPRPQSAAMPYSYATCAYFPRYAAAPEVRGDAGREHPQGSGIFSTPKPPAAQNCPQPVRYFTTVHLLHDVAAPEVRGDAGHECPPGPGTSSTPQPPAAQTFLLDVTSPLRARAGPLPSRFRPCPLVFRCRVPVCQLRCLVASDARFSAPRPACEVVSHDHINRSLELEALGSASVGRVCSKGSNMSSEATPLSPQPIGYVTTVHLPCCVAAPEVRDDAGRERLQGPGISSVPRPPAAQLSPPDVPPLPSARAAPVPLWFWPRPLGFRCRVLVCQSRCQVSTAQLRSNRTACEVSVDNVSCPRAFEVLRCASVGVPSTTRHDPHAGERIGEASNPGPRPVPLPLWFRPFPLGFRCWVRRCNLQCQADCHAQPSPNHDASAVSCCPAHFPFDFEAQGGATVSRGLVQGRQNCSFAASVYFPCCPAAPEVQGDVGRELPSVPRPPVSQNFSLETPPPPCPRAVPLTSRFWPCCFGFWCRVPVCTLRGQVVCTAPPPPPCACVVSRNHGNRRIEGLDLGIASAGRVCPRGSRTSSEVAPLCCRYAMSRCFNFYAVLLHLRFKVMLVVRFRKDPEYPPCLGLLLRNNPRLRCQSFRVPAWPPSPFGLDLAPLGLGAVNPCSTRVARSFALPSSGPIKLRAR